MATKKMLSDSSGQIWPITRSDCVYTISGNKNIETYITEQLATKSPTGHTHDYLPFNGTLTSGDLNDIKTTGYYSLKGSLTNAPASGHAMLFVDFTVGTPFQLFMHDATFAFYKRNWNATNAAWGSWTSTVANSISGNAASASTASKVNNALSIQLNGGTATTFDGSAAKSINITPASIGAAASSHGTHLSLGTTSSTAYRGDYGNTAYTHSQAAHAPSNAQKNSDITKAEIEAKLTGAITTHTHSYLPLSGGQLTGRLTFPSTATSTDVNAPTQLAYGLLGAYGTLKILANTDNAAGADNEYVHIAAARGLEPTASQGITVYGTYANCFGKKISTEGHTHAAVNRTFITTPIYNPDKGILIDFNTNVKSGIMAIIKIYGNSYSSNPPIEAIYQFYDYADGDLMQQTGSAISGPAITLKVYKIDGKLKAWFKQPNSYCTFKVEATYGNNSSTPNITLSNAAEPTTNITQTITITPNRVYSAAYKPTPADIGAAASSHGTHVSYGGNGSATTVSRSDHTHSYLPLSGGTMTGKITTPNNAQGITIGDDVTLCDRNIADHLVLEGSTATNGGITFGSGKDTNIYRGGANLLKTDDTMNAVGGFQWNGQSLDSRYAAASHGTHLTIGTGASNAAAGNHTHSGYASSSHTHTSILNQDTRSVNTAPGDVPVGLSVHLKSNGTDGLSDGENYHSSLFIKGWNDYSGGPFGNIAISANNNLWYRASSSGTAWNSWKKVSVDGHTHSYLSTGGGTLTGALTISGNSKNLTMGTGGADVYITNSASGKYLQLKDNGTLSYSDQAIYHTGNKPSPADIGAATSNHEHSGGSSGKWWNNSYVRIGNDGVSEVGKYIDFHLANGNTTDNDGRLTLLSANALHFNGTLAMTNLEASGYLYSKQIGITDSTNTWSMRGYMNGSQAKLVVGNQTNRGYLILMTGAGSGNGSAVQLEVSHTAGVTYAQFLSPEAGTIALTKHLSDRTRKDNIVYVDSKESKFTNKDFYNFVKDDLDLATYNLKKEYASTDTHTKINFIAQDILWDFEKNEENKVGNLIVQAEDAMEQQLSLKYDPDNYVSVLAGALKEAINEIELLKKETQLLRNELNKLKKDRE